MGMPSQETTLWETRPSIWMHGRRVVFAILLSLVLAGLPWLLWLYLDARCTLYQLSSERLTWQRGVLSRRRTQIELYRVRDFALLRPWWLRPLGLGTVVVYSSGITTPDEAMLAIRHPDEVFALLRAAVEAVRTAKGIRAIDFETRNG